MERKRLPLEIQPGEQVSFRDTLYRVVKEMTGGWQGQLHLRPVTSSSKGEKMEPEDEVAHRSSVVRLHSI